MFAPDGANPQICAKKNAEVQLGMGSGRGDLNNYRNVLYISKRLKHCAKLLWFDPTDCWG